MNTGPNCMNYDCAEWRRSKDDHICLSCGFHPAENVRRKALIHEKGLTPDRWGARRLILRRGQTNE